MPKGGLRPGAGRPPAAEKKSSVLVRLNAGVASALRATIPDKARSAWIEEQIVKALRKRPGEESP